ncbi:MAG: putative glycoside hydrolase [Oscillospiraceae bacterium]|nr:putative glycoside hydrolase [Oscillospiraceae bacterium]
MPKYGSYYGKKKHRRIRAVVLILLLCGVAALCVFVLPDYISYTEDGLSVELPFLARFGRRPPSPTPPYVIVEDPPSPSPSPVPQPSPSPPPAPRIPEQVRALFLPLPMLGDIAELDSIRRRAADESITIIALEYKDVRGTIVNPSILTAALETLSDPKLTLTAVISACADSTVPFGANADWALKHTTGVNFRDPLDRRWLNLYLPEVRAFIIRQTLDAYEAGFDRVLLSHVGFPPVGGLNQIRYSEEELEIGPVAAVERLLDDLRAAAGERPLDAWVFDATAKDGFFEAAGQDMAMFVWTFDLLFAALPDDDLYIDPPLIPVVSAADSHKLEFAEQGFMLLYSATE